jgi:hypothetical protein
MKYILFFIILRAFIFPQDKNVTHNLELLTTNADQPINLDISVYNKENNKYILIQFPDEYVETDYICLDSAQQVKFQISRIRNDKLVNIQFIGNGTINTKVNGKFIALVDGILRDDMSGTFKLKKNEF